MIVFAEQEDSGSFKTPEFYIIFNWVLLPFCGHWGLKLCTVVPRTADFVINTPLLLMEGDAELAADSGVPSSIFGLILSVLTFQE